MIDLIVKFTGDQAEEHRVPAYEGTQSLVGISRSLVLVGDYLFGGKIRKRYPFGENVQFYLTSTRPGSLETIITAIVNNPELLSIAKDVSIDVAKNFLVDGIKHIFNRAIGTETRPTTDELRELENLKPGDLDALTDAIEPSLRLGHTVVGRGAQNVVIINGHNNVVNFSANSKAYINGSEISDELEEMDVSVGSLNANTGYGRVYVRDLGKTVPFVIASNPDRGTKGALSSSLDRYTHNQPSDVRIKFRRVTSPDGRTKKFIIYGAEIANDA